MIGWIGEMRKEKYQGAFQNSETDPAELVIVAQSQLQSEAKERQR